MLREKGKGALKSPAALAREKAAKTKAAEEILVRKKIRNELIIEKMRAGETPKKVASDMKISITLIFNVFGEAVARNPEIEVIRKKNMEKLEEKKRKETEEKLFKEMEKKFGKKDPPKKERDYRVYIKYVFEKAKREPREIPNEKLEETFKKKQETYRKAAIAMQDIRDKAIPNQRALLGGRDLRNRKEENFIGGKEYIDANRKVAKCASEINGFIEGLIEMGLVKRESHWVAENRSYDVHRIL
ncbi:MAG: hypothetical protein WC308_02825 [archaeon]|jgi:hypothetical protein